LECSKILDQLKSTPTPYEPNLPNEVEAMAAAELESMPKPETLDEITDNLSDALSEPPPLSSDRDEYDLPPMKRARTTGGGGGEMSLEEYEAMLDAEDGPGGFLEGGDIASR
jgi:hypothetical protein